MPLLATAVALFSAALITPATAYATDVQTGFDPVIHIPPSYWDFGPLPLPADYFGPGSDPFDGGVPADASVLPGSPWCPGPLGNTSMIIQRQNVAVLPVIPSSDVIDVEIVELSLVSANPITVTYFGGVNPELWDVEITLSASLASTGSMTIRQEHANGGTFDAAILLQPYFTFTRQSDSFVVELDGAGTYQDLIEAIDVPWVYNDPTLACPSCVTNFIPGHNGVGPVNYAYTGLSSQHTVRAACASTAIPTLSEWGLIAATTLLLILGAYTIVRRRKAATFRTS
jgi:hypothetical protein